MSSYLKQFLIVGVPVMVTLTAFFSLLLGFNRGLIPGLLIGLFVGGFISLILGFLYSKSTKDLLSDQLREIKSRPARRLIFLPYFILLLGAIYTRYSGQILPSFVLTIILTMAVYILCSYFLGEFKKSLKEGELLTYIAVIITRLIPFTITYFIFLSAVCGFDFNRIKSLFVR